MIPGADVPRPLLWRGSSKRDFMTFPADVQREMGYALFLAQKGERHVGKTKTLKGFGGGTVIEIRDSGAGSAFRAIYTVRFAQAVYVLHAFQKKSKTGIVTPLAEMRMIQRRFAELISERNNRP